MVPSAFVFTAMVLSAWNQKCTSIFRQFSATSILIGCTVGAHASNIFSVPGLPAAFYKLRPSCRRNRFFEPSVKDSFAFFSWFRLRSDSNGFCPRSAIKYVADFSIFCQFPLSIHHDPLHVGYYSAALSTIPSFGIRTSIDFCRCDKLLLHFHPSSFEIADFFRYHPVSTHSLRPGGISLSGPL